MSAQPTEPKGTLSVIKPDAKSPAAKTEPRYVYDFGKLKRRERERFGDDMAKVFKAKDNNLSTNDADAIAVQWMRKLLTKYPDGCDFRVEEVFEEISAPEWKVAQEAFAEQFLDAFGIEREKSQAV